MASTSRKWSQLIPALGATVGAFGCGTMLVWSTPALLHLDPRYCVSDENTTNNNNNNTDETYSCDIEMSKQEAIWVNAIAFLGCIFCVPFAGFAMGWLGKKWTMISLGAPFALGILLITFAKNSAMLIIGRLLYGFSSGAFGLLVPSYTSETAEQSIKGALGSLQQLIVTLGVLFVGVLGKYVEWRTMTGIFLFIPILMAVWMVFMPESPVYLVTKGKMEEAKKSLLFLRGPNFDADSELTEIKANVQASKDIGTVSLKTLLGTKQYVLPTMISIVLMFLQQFSGVNAVLAYAVQLFEDAGLGETIDSFTANILVGVTQFAFVIVSMALVDRFGRKILLIISDVIMGLAMVALGAYFLIKELAEDDTSLEATVEDIKILPIAATMIFTASFSIGFGPLPWVLNSELFPREAKALASSIGAMSNWFFAFLVVYFYPMAESAINKYVCYFFFAVICFLGALFIILFVPETKGKTEEDMSQYFRQKTNKKNPKDNGGYDD